MWVIDRELQEAATSSAAGVGMLPATLLISLGTVPSLPCTTEISTPTPSESRIILSLNELWLSIRPTSIVPQVEQLLECHVGLPTNSSPGKVSTLLPARGGRVLRLQPPTWSVKTFVFGRLLLE